MEMHQIRYFLALSQVLNFTRAAEACHVAQPSLTRAIKNLEAELGGDLFRRERAHTHLTELGRLLHPALQQTYDSATAVKDLAHSFQRAERAPLCLALSHTFDSGLLTPFLSELAHVLPGLEVRMFRGAGAFVVEQLKEGVAELAIAGPLGDDWERFDTWELFNESFAALAPKSHELVRKNNAIGLEALSGESLLPRKYCEQADHFISILRRYGIRESTGYNIESETDLVSLVEAGLGVALVPETTKHSEMAGKIELCEPELARPVSLYSVAGRQRSPASSAFMKLLRAADWENRLQPRRVKAASQ